MEIMRLFLDFKFHFASVFRFLYLAFFLFCFAGSPAYCAQWEITSETIIRTFERERLSGPLGSIRGEKKFLLPAYEYLGVDYGDSETGGFSLHMYGWGRKDLAGSDFYQDDPDGELLYGYIQYAKPYSQLRLALGRQHIFAGVANESFDGLMVSTGLGTYFSATAFGGLPSSFAEDNGRDGDFIYGARVAFRPTAVYEIGLSYQMLEDDGRTIEERAGLDLALNVGSWLNFSGMTSYNIETQGWREHSYTAQIRHKSLQLEPSYQYFQYKDYFNVNSQRTSLFGFLADSDEAVNIAGADLLWQARDFLQLGLRGRRYAYDLRREDAYYYAGLVTLIANGGSQLGLEAGHMDGDTPENIYTLYRAYAYWQNPGQFSGAFLSADLLFQDYEASVFGKNSAVHASLSGGYSFAEDTYQAKLSGIYSNDPFFDKDFGAVFTLLIRY